MSKINKRLNKVLATLDDKELTKVAYKKFVEVTPVDKGNARRNTKKQGNEIVANYPYATRLEEGYSKQAPQGMSEPTIEYIQEYVFQKTGVRI
jgi:hypothetical protein